MRLLNVLGLIAVYYCCVSIVKLRYGTDQKATATAVCCFPILTFFSHLFYTDVLSLLFVLLCVRSNLQQRYILAAAFGFISMTFRQTNVAWVFFSGGISLLRLIRETGTSSKRLLSLIISICDRRSGADGPETTRA